MMDFAWKQAPRENDRDNVLRCVYAAPTASTYVEQFKERYGIEAFVDAFGLTETCAPIMSPYGEPRPPGAAGLQNKEWFDIRLVDPETDREVEVGEVGELVVRPVHPWTASNGYYNMPEKTVETWRNLWFHTGDALRRDEDGWYYFIDRYKDALRRRGENISSYEVEQAILGHPAVVECAVIGVPADQEAGEDEVLAVVVASEAGRRRRDPHLVRGPHPRLRHPALPARRVGRCRRRRPRRSARPPCARTASPPTPTTAPQPAEPERRTTMTTTTPYERHPMQDWVPETRTLLIGDRMVDPEGERWDVLQPGDRGGHRHRRWRVGRAGRRRGRSGAPGVPGLGRPVR